MNEVLNSVNLDAKVRASVNYAHAREAINSSIGSRKERRRLKMAVIEHLQGKVVSVKGNGRHTDKFGNVLARVSVHFPDGSKAVF